MTNAQIDLGLSVLPLERNTLSATQYTEADYRILMDKNHPLATCESVQLAQLQPEKWIGHGPETGLYFEQLEQACQQVNFNRQPNIVHLVPSFDLLKSMVRLGRGMAFIPASLDLQQEPQLLSKPILHPDGTSFKQVVIQHVLVYKSEHPKPLVQVLSGLVKVGVTASTP